MKMFGKAAAEEGIYVRVVQSVGAIDYAFCEGECIHVINGAVPPELAAVSEPGGDRSKAKTLDAKLFSQRRRRSGDGPVVKAPAPLTRADVRRRFNWSEQQFDAAKTCGFPAGTQTIRTRAWRGGPEHLYVWFESDIATWCERMRLIAHSID